MLAYTKHLIAGPQRFMSTYLSEKKSNPVIIACAGDEAHISDCHESDGPCNSKAQVTCGKKEI